ncbi:hypothetical protein LPB86_16825 [Pedobacter sp. MC2016-14]|uniref:hypothetical protein n=1 Tax=Pedobacter sp. MC2016-14 TaxID=2897327 RepID=UPI001E320258|nr:hypothetical protein [Pedobacter sp. MC2016-14]MCD0489908.1 hypothetical protein [Pedobacter sp. MC2016-14]
MKFRASAYIIGFSLLIMLASCDKKRVAQTSFYYWKTVYQDNATAQQYFKALQCKKLYVRMMDVDAGENGPVPISPITFKTTLPDSVEMIPVVFIVNNVLKNQSHHQLDYLADKIIYYVNGKIRQAGKSSFKELQIDCDWTRSTRDNYFYLLNRIKANKSLKNKVLSATLRLHQLKNIKVNGIPPVTRVMLMCYNMGNLRKYGTQNSILDQTELEKYMGKNLSSYPKQVDVGLPLFSWAVVFRQKQYAGIAKGLHRNLLNNQQSFKALSHHFYLLLHDLPDHGLKRGDEIRWEDVSTVQLNTAATYIEKYLKADTVNVIYFHLDELTLKQHTYENLEKTTALFR